MSWNMHARSVAVPDSDAILTGPSLRRFRSTFRSSAGPAEPGYNIADTLILADPNKNTNTRGTRTGVRSTD